MIPKRRKPPKLNCNSAPQIRSAGHLKFVRGFECSALRDRESCQGRIEAAHVRTGTDGGTGLKPSDCWTVPLCSLHHAQQHQIGERSFEVLHGIDLRTIADLIWLKSPHRRKVEP
jgi:hypothetical protein